MSVKLDIQYTMSNVLVKYAANTQTVHFGKRVLTNFFNLLSAK